MIENWFENSKFVRETIKVFIFSIYLDSIIYEMKLGYLVKYAVAYRLML